MSTDAAGMGVDISDKSVTVMLGIVMGFIIIDHTSFHDVNP